MKSLKMCPKCNAKLKVSPDGETQYCPICKYWTKVGTARLDSIMIYG
jgi:Zn-finger nucleic acid-binding protein